MWFGTGLKVWVTHSLHWGFKAQNFKDILGLRYVTFVYLAAFVIETITDSYSTLEAKAVKRRRDFHLLEYYLVDFRDPVTPRQMLIYLFKDQRCLSSKPLSLEVT